MKKKILWLIATLVLGALGSGLWELAFRPFFALLASGALDVVTLGLDSLRNGLYEEAARGQYERVSITILSAGAGVMVGITMVLLLFPFFRQRLEGTRPSVAGSRKFTLALPLVFATTMMLLLFQRNAYINRAANHFEQLATIAAPFQSQEQRLQLHSEFAQMNTRETYVRLVETLSALAKAKGARVPEFTIY
ncbi:hypothetical protein [Azoarcus olearius]|uniref:Hypothetical membrane protein n=1 Tax=Azoarcus sp. (strain BH72) TaxID=418699 RepID=A1KA36_AZOSB|nr:hypothetical protein [Azoarcus olearius]CAL95692.1 hypothetical membrane protein [Azoarcus olearius]